LPKLIGVQQPPVGGDWGVELLVLVQQADVLRHGVLPLLKRGDDDLQEPLEGASLGLHLHVEWVPHDEREHGDEHGDGGDPEPPAPPNVLLDVHHHGERQQNGEPHAEEVEVEVAPLLLAARTLAALAELVGAKRHDAGPDAAAAERGEEQGTVQHGELPAVRALARQRGRSASGTTGRGAERGDERGHDEAQHAELVQHAAPRDGPEAAGTGVGDDGAQDRRECRGAVEVGEQVGGLHERQVQLLRQVCDHVGVEAGRREPVADLVCCNAGAGGRASVVRSSMYMLMERLLESRSGERKISVEARAITQYEWHSPEAALLRLLRRCILVGQSCSLHA
jgi:hypothetical protein